jgi:hypothetical protein
MTKNKKIHKELLMAMDKKITKKEQSHFSNVVGCYVEVRLQNQDESWVKYKVECSSGVITQVQIKAVINKLIQLLPNYQTDPFQ